MKFGSVCSGIEAASVAWEPLGWSAVWLSEIEPFPCAVLAHHWPAVPNLGDMTLIKERISSHEIEAPEVFTGGTPCQAFSVAGKRGSLDDARGNLTLEFVRIADAIDDVRQQRNEPETIIVWENVPGVLNTKDNAFGCFLAALAGEDCELKPSGKKWTNAGCVYGPKRAIAWRVIDAQYFGVAQRRKRVFVIASARKGFDPAAVLFESEGVRRDSAPSREKRKDFTELAGTLAANTGGTTRPAGNGNELDFCVVDKQDVWPKEIASTLNAAFGSKLGLEDQHINSGAPLFVLHGTQDPIISKDRAHALGRNNGAENAVFALAGNCIGRKPENGGNGKGYDDTGSCYTLTSTDQHAVLAQMSVRRLTPIECERLQGFPDNHTDVPYRNKPASDGPRYKAIGNSWAVPCARWIGERIQQHLIAMEEAA